MPRQTMCCRAETRMPAVRTSTTIGARTVVAADSEEAVEDSRVAVPAAGS